MTPQQKKALSYTNDRRNAYGQSHGGSLKGIRRHKRTEARAGRRQANQTLGQVVSDPELTVPEDGSVDTRPVRRWRKFADQPLGKLIAQGAARRVEFYIRVHASGIPTLYDELESELRSIGIHERQTDDICLNLRSQQDAPARHLLTYHLNLRVPHGEVYGVYSPDIRLSPSRDENLTPRANNKGCIAAERSGARNYTPG